MGFFNKAQKKNRKKALVVGLDGVPYTMLNELRKNGTIPNMNSIFSNGYFGQMNVCIPEISSVSWSSFMTGTQSGEHGIYGFMDLEPGTYKMFFPNYSHLKAPTIWDDLAVKGKKTVVINMPATYPAHETNGALVSGFVAVDINKAVFPTSYISKLNEIDYRIDLDMIKAREDHDYLFHDLDITLKSRKRAVELFQKEIDWDLFIVVITGTDRLMHFLWDAYKDENHKYHKAFLEYFSKVDSFVGWLYDWFQNHEGSNDDNDFYMLSDHGFTGIKTEVYLNKWFEENSFLKFNKDKPETIMDIGPGSIAFAMDPSRVYINLKKKYPLGTVDQNDYNRVCLDIKNALESLSFQDDSMIFKKVYLKEEIYHGKYLENAPDLILLANHGYDLKGRVNSSQVFDRTVLEGMHTQDDAFFFSSNGISCDSIFHIKDLILNSL